MLNGKGFGRKMWPDGGIILEGPRETVQIADVPNENRSENVWITSRTLPLD
jgi:hypothetical protein